MGDIVHTEAEGKETDEKFIGAELAFSLSLFKAAAGDSKKGNMLISPLSVLLALSMAACGAGGETLAEIEEVLGLTAEELNAYLYTYVSSLPQSEKNKFKAANSFWFRDDGSISINKPFLQKIDGYYGAHAYSAPFDESTVKDINKWVDDNTEGLIKKVINSIDSETVMFIINALVFEAEWASVYEKSEIEKGKFTSINGEERNVKYMHTYENNCFYKDDAVGFVKYYSGGKYAFAAVMPSQGDVYDYAGTLTEEKFTDLFDFSGSESERYAEVYLPKFQYEYSIDMKEVFRTLGINEAFGQNADFSGIGETGTGQLYIYDVIHKTYISVDERGTKAGAVTAIKGGCGAMPAPGREIHFDRPFVYFIMDMNTKLPVFMGIASDIGE